MAGKAIARLSVSQTVSVVMSKSRVSVSALPQYLWVLIPFFAWAFTAVFLGLIVGLGAVILPPTGTFGFIAVVGLVLLWVMPDFPIAPLRKTRVLFVIMLFAFLCVPNYYAIDLSALPWISARRISIFPLIMLFGISLSMSSSIRRDLVSAFAANKLLSLGAIGFFVTIIFSFFTSNNPVASMSSATDAFLTWLVPWLVTLYVVRSDRDVRRVVNIIVVTAPFVGVVGVVEFFLQRHIAVDLLPSALLQRLMANNISVALMVTANPFRDGMYRAISIFTTPLSFGEYMSVVVPFGIFIVVYRPRLLAKMFGIALILCCITGVTVAGARGGNIAMATSTAAFIGLWYFRSRKFSPYSLGASVVAVIGILAFAVSTVAVVAWPRAHNWVLGGGQASYSTVTRTMQWEMSKSHIVANPITGHGFGLGGEIIDNGSLGEGFTIDSYVLSLLVETGIPSFIFFCLMLFSAIAYSAKRYLTDPSPEGALNGALSCSIVAYATYRLVLSQRENHTLLFILIGLIMIGHELYQRGIAVKAAPLPTGSGFRTVLPVGKAVGAE